MPVGVRLEVAARPLERARGARRLAAAAVDLAEVHERARLGVEIAPAARRLEVALEVRLGAIDLAAAEQRHAGQKVHRSRSRSSDDTRRAAPRCTSACP